MSSEASGTLEGHRKGRVPRALRLKQLLDVAEELFVTEGYDRTTIEEICRVAGVSRPIVYSLVGNKATLYLACVRRARAELERSIAMAAGSSEDPQEQLTRGSEAYFVLLEKDPRRWELFLVAPGSSASSPTTWHGSACARSARSPPCWPDTPQTPIRSWSRGTPA